MGGNSHGAVSLRRQLRRSPHAYRYADSPVSWRVEDPSGSSSSSGFLVRRISWRRKAPTAIRKAAQTKRGGVNADRSASTVHLLRASSLCLPGTLSVPPRYRSPRYRPVPPSVLPRRILGAFCGRTAPQRPRRRRRAARLTKPPAAPCAALANARPPARKPASSYGVSVGVGVGAWAGSPGQLACGAAQRLRPGGHARESRARAWRQTA
jgi:hypothetical protein